jgi:hypothetical protein
LTIAEDVYEPLPLYRDVFREKFRENAESFLADLVAKSGVDVKANAATVRDIRAIAEQLSKAETARAGWGWAIGLSIVALVGLAIGFFCVASDEGSDAAGTLAALVGGAIAILPLLFGVFIPKHRHYADVAKAIQERLERRKAVAWAQMAPLNALFDWGDAAKIIEKTVPRLSFDPYFTQGRLSELHDLFGWSDEFNDGKSVLGAQSGEINGNPFVFGRLLQMDWGVKTYSGSREVSWTETERDADGKLRTVRRYQTLTAYVDKPIPEYSQDIFLLYGNDAAPKLTFTRSPSSLSNAGNGFFGRMRMKSQIKSLERFSRNLDDQYGYMIMGNREFEALFETRDRSDETEYRLLFTPLAQKQMLEILKDKTVGYGDDFSFIKAHKINMIRAAHLSNADLDTNPSKFADYDFESVKAKFLAFCGNYFKATYFALAPLLAIPLYQQTRTHANIYKDVYSRRSSFWEHESLANYLGEHRFRHPQSVTRNILKTHVRRRENEVATVAVTAYGYRTERRVDVVSVRANNGRYYDVDVEWDEYLPVSQTTDIRATEREGLSKPDFDIALNTSEDWQNFFRSWGSDAARAAFRRSIVSF